MIPDLLSAFDSNRFGFPIGRASCASTTEADHAVETALEEGAELLILRFPTEDAKFGRWLQKLSFEWIFADTLLYYRQPIHEAKKIELDGGYVCRWADQDDLDLVEALAVEMFSDYASHYRWNPRTRRPDLIAKGYGEWARRLAAASPLGAVVFETDDGEPAALGCVEAPGEVGTMALAGVAPAHWRRGLYRPLVESVYELLRERGCKVMETSTQVHHVVVQRVWTRIGMALTRSSHTVHLDLRAPLDEVRQRAEPGLVASR